MPSVALNLKQFAAIIKQASLQAVQKLLPYIAIYT